VRFDVSCPAFQFKANYCLRFNLSFLNGDFVHEVSMSDFAFAIHWCLSTLRHDGVREIQFLFLKTGN